MSRRKNPVSVILSAVLAGPAGPAGPACAATLVWIGGSADWDASTAKWNPAGEPGAGDTAVFQTTDQVVLANPGEQVGLHPHQPRLLRLNEPGPGKAIS